MDLIVKVYFVLNHTCWHLLKSKLVNVVNISTVTDLSIYIKAPLPLTHRIPCMHGDY